MLRVGIAHHYGWAVAVTADAEHRVVDRRRIELLAPGLPPAPIHHVGGPHAMHRPAEPVDDATLAVLVAEVRGAVGRAAAAALDELADVVGAPIVSLSVRDWPDGFPTDVAVLRRPPYESRADSVMYCQVLAGAAATRGWAVHRYDARTVEADAVRRLGAAADDVLHGPRRALGAPWSKDHRTALAATVLAR